MWQRLINFGWGEPDVALPLIAAGCAVLVGLLLAVTRWLLRRPRPAGRLPLWIILPPLASLAFALRWTPMPRYAGATMWLIGIIATLLAGGEWLRQSTIGRGASVCAAVAAAAWLAALAPTIWPGLRDFETAPVIPTDARVLASGLRVNVPRGVDTCFAAPLPCAPNPDPRLKLRRPDDLGGGFEIDGGGSLDAVASYRAP